MSTQRVKKDDHHKSELEKFYCRFVKCHLNLIIAAVNQLLACQTLGKRFIELPMISMTITLRCVLDALNSKKV
ncbi:hypothetical protein YK48G_05210 [Lentilactobacillus fungorum]|uniref:Transposase n=1 Tax=Lentilactobacillus fungorum TaxID=2201250 RepID=A0ABQ3VY34_9LACO|nr:hypothetical protein YK48G_05210 [Lentilactobacillus fungorum]